jgi:hypothetical protein
MRLLREENSVLISQDGIELSYQFLQESRSSFVFIQAEVVRISPATGDEFILRPGYIQVLQKQQAVSEPQVAKERSGNGMIRQDR